MGLFVVRSVMELFGEAFMERKKRGRKQNEETLTTNIPKQE